ncbi:MAG: YkgJ family cysteine cluster protein [Dorea sp.]|nr:YkgJ family cysteine cluster protein [Dorea sp.]
MLREIDLKEISDGKLYGCNDMVKADCNGCVGCSVCCHGMGNSIVLDPYDVYRLSKGLTASFEQLLTSALELNVVDGIILPNLKMAGKEEACSFLNDKGRCSIHPYRPGICRLFPLGRFYEKDSFQYFLQIHECPKPGKSKVKVKKWMDTENLKQYEDYICKWHYYLKMLQERAMTTESDELRKQLSMFVLQIFYLAPYDFEQDFYGQFEMRLAKAKEITDKVL